MWLRSSLLLLSLVCYGQTAITALSSYIPMDITADRIAWDYHADRHALYYGTSAGISTTFTPIFGRGVKLSAGSLAIPIQRFSTTGTFTIGVWCRNSGGGCVTRWKDHTTVPQQIMWSMTFNGVPGRAQVSGDGFNVVVPAGIADKSADQLALLWFTYDSVAGLIKVAVDNSSWYSTTAPGAFTNNNQYPVDIASKHGTSGYGVTVGDMMIWNGYIPTDAERSAIWNGGNGQPYTYFNPAGYTPPTRPLTVSLVTATFADDNNLTGQQGLYFLRPYPLKIWTPSLVAGRGQYVWLRSTDHQAGNNAGGIWRGYSDSPTVLPISWTLIQNAAMLSIADPTYDWYQLETPYLAWNNETSLFHLYGHAVRANSSAPVIQTTHVWTSPDLNTWTWRGPAFPNITGRNHTGYASVVRRGPNDWIANTLLTDSTAPVPSLSGTWTSTDGLNWSPGVFETATSEDIYVVPQLPYNEVGRTERTSDGTYVGGFSYFSARASGTDWSHMYPPYKMFDHLGTGTGGDWLQDVRMYEEGGTVWLYAKWSYQEPSTIRLYKGTLPQSSSPRFGGALRIGGTASVK